MKVMGIIAEFNPFHSGHAYLAKMAREEFGADYVVAAMTGDFVQRGGPAIVDKYARARMALSGGIDLVLEIPALFSTSSAEPFAQAGVSLLGGLGCVSGLCFGVEDDSPLIADAARVLAEEPAPFRSALSAALRNGKSFPAARSEALCGILGDGAAPILSSPNNILAIEYEKAIIRLGSPIAPCPIRRVGAGHDSGEMPICGDGESDSQGLASASAIRNFLAKLEEDGRLAGDNLPQGTAQVPSGDALHDGAAMSDSLPQGAAQALSGDALHDGAAMSNSLPQDAARALSLVMPQGAAEILASCAASSGIAMADDFSLLLGERLLSMRPDDFSRILDAGGELASRIRKKSAQFRDFSQFCALLKTKNITYSRVSRALTHLLLGLTSEDAAIAGGAGFPPYLRVLGFREKTERGQSTAPLLRALRDAPSPVLARPARDGKKLPGGARRLLELDAYAADLYEWVRWNKARRGPRHNAALPPRELSRQIIRL